MAADPLRRAEDGARETELAVLVAQELAFIACGSLDLSIHRPDVRAHWREQGQRIADRLVAALAQQADGETAKLLDRYRVALCDSVVTAYSPAKVALVDQARTALRAHVAAQAARHREAEDRYESQLDEVSGSLSASQSIAAERLALLKDAEAEVARLRARLAEVWNEDSDAEDYAGHKSECRMQEDETCTCGWVQWKERTRAALKGRPA